MSRPPALSVRGLTRIFDVSPPWLNRVLEGAPKRKLRAVDTLDFDVPDGGCLSRVGESGCGKPTVARLVTGLVTPTDGTPAFGTASDGRRYAAQMIFQDPGQPRTACHRVEDENGAPAGETETVPAV
ncbi:ATP-binding cassette domain-containing protein [Thalassorhabdomicrobium marinisediminis]|uniref:ABC transporter domain-containing protein n=1 Tax=Thalassorhabdomicrobium marinisediminis TaxID=2170577 RepID=A0A2T7FTK7_9RHOB|nr:ATP-binding cassette domain-containing protein [Thalassorhabdomicrobium marinisediminis]PVA05508.1 hypothetical protein DC363_14795 [Thalassorhabdomicrobium marinisediminis]